MQASTDGKQLAEETIAICTDTQNKGRSVMNIAKETKSILSDLKGITPAKFMTIKNFVESGKKDEIISMVTGMDDLAVQCSSKAAGMHDAMQRGVDSLPDVVKDENNNAQEGDTDHEEDALDFESDITELEECTENLKSMNLLSATTKGTSAFEGLISKSEVCQTVFEQIKELSASIARLSQTFMMDNCCAQIKAGMSSLKEMMKCLRLTNIIQTLADAGRRMITAFINLIKVAWRKIGDFLEEFPAAKKIKTFVDGLNPLKSPAGKFVAGAANLFGSITGRDAPAITNRDTPVISSRGAPEIANNQSSSKNKDTSSSSKSDDETVNSNGASSISSLLNSVNSCFG